MEKYKCTKCKNPLTKEEFNKVGFNKIYTYEYYLYLFTEKSNGRHN